MSSGIGTAIIAKIYIVEVIIKYVLYNIKIILNLYIYN